MNDQCLVSVVIFVLNEEENLPRCLDSLTWCNDIHVVDSFSTDRTLEICRDREIPIAQNEFKGFGSQRNWALDNLALANDWILILDADESVPPELSRELCRLAKNTPHNIGAYRIRRRFYLWGRWLRYSSLYPTWVVRFVHRRRVRYIDRGHAETQEIVGATGQVDGFLIDENLKGIDEWFERQNRYSRAEAQFELEGGVPAGALRAVISSDPLQRRAVLKSLVGELPFRGALYFIYCYVFRLGFLDGRAGYTFCRMKSMFQSMVSIKKYDERKR